MAVKGYARTNLSYMLFGKYLFHCSIHYWMGVDDTLRAELSGVCISIDTEHIAQMVDKLTISYFSSR
ncbi:hypothetical protein LSH36_703g01017 [Paralvinella palmiformis]|uniref:Uncharacterized protein n=1 Tax=Paralvinella palmiformis TaxID=53620 RepID=A0AAD9MTR0_9ANNE|nr:hypothetical protein LSH36_703g01017 [Paralvinella palmiformis]